MNLLEIIKKPRAIFLDADSEARHEMLRVASTVNFAHRSEKKYKY